MEVGRRGRSGEGEPARGGPARRGNDAQPKPRKKKRPTPSPSPLPLPSPSGSPRPVPQPYLALAPTPISQLHASSLSGPSSSSSLVLPSTYSRRTTPAPRPAAAAPSPKPASRRNDRYAANLLSPPAIMPGGSALPPRVQGSPGGGAGPRRRSEERLHVLASSAANASMLSLGHLGQILESDPMADGSGSAQVQGETRRRGAAGRRRRIVQGEEVGGLTRRLTVSTREEGRALGLARGASMRRTNVWDDIQENEDPPPAFPFPTPSNTRLPPTFETVEEHSPLSTPVPAPALSTQQHPIPNSPPPTFAQAIGLEPLPRPPDPDLEPLSTPSTPRPLISISTLLPSAGQTERGSSVGSPTSTRYVSAPSSPVASDLALSDGADDGEEPGLDGQENVREDRLAWEEDLQRGLSFTSRVRREAERRKAREVKVPAPVSAHTMAFEPRQDSAFKLRETTERQVDAEVAMVESPVLGAEGGAVGGPGQEGSADLPGPVDDQLGPTPIVDVAAAITSPAGDLLERPEETIAEGNPEITEGETAATDSERGAQVESLETPSTLSENTMCAPSPSEDESGVRRESVAAVPTNTIAPTIPPTIDESPLRLTSHPIKASPEVSPTMPAQDQTPLNLPNAETSVVAQELPPRDVSPTPEPPVAQSYSVPSPDEPLSTAPPTRKLTRGKAIRRSSSGLTNITTSPSPRLSKRLSAGGGEAKPLFQEDGYFVNRLNRSPRLDLSERIDAPQQEVRVGFAHRMSEPAISLGQREGWKTARQLGQQEPEENSRLQAEQIPEAGQRERTKSQPNLSDYTSSPVEPSISPLSASPSTANAKLPIHREAALLRRPLTVRRRESSPPPAPTSAPRIVRPTVKIASPHSPIRGPLIDLSDFEMPPSSPLAPLSEANEEGGASVKASSLARHTHDLLALLEEGAGAGESSRQGREREDLIRAIREVSPTGSATASTQDVPATSNPRPESPKETVQSLVNKKAPPPPPPFKIKSRSQEYTPPSLPTATSPTSPIAPVVKSDRPTRKLSILSTATSPIIPRRRAPGVPTPNEKREEPTRRPPPPPPTSSRASEIIPLSSEDDPTQPPPLPPRPPPPPFLQHRTSSTSSSLFEKPPTLSLKPPLLEQASSPNLRMRVVPRGPRPPPPPIPRRPWARVVAESVESSGKRHLVERTKSDGVLMMERSDGEGEGEEEEDEGSLRGSDGPSSVLDTMSDGTLGQEARRGDEIDGQVEQVSAGSAGRRVTRSGTREYTDLDVLLSRLEGSGREYEGFSQISAFLGPSKSSRATPAALATLLPGLITVDSRRVTPQGRVKLKLSMLGVRVAKCPICLQQFREGERGIMLPKCGHVGHEGCANRWWREESKCFVCRVPLEEEEGVI